MLRAAMAMLAMARAVPAAAVPLGLGLDTPPPLPAGGELECVRGGVLEGTLSRLYFDHLSRKGKVRSAIEKISVQVKKSQSNFRNLRRTSQSNFYSWRLQSQMNCTMRSRI
eukprot:scaffold16452_cov116-Isochrysis_galbana.AAC.2